MLRISMFLLCASLEWIKPPEETIKEALEELHEDQKKESIKYEDEMPKCELNDELKMDCGKYDI